MARDNQLFKSIYNRLLDRLSALKPGDLLGTEAELAQLLGASRTTIRAALAQMSEQGIVAWNGRSKCLTRMPRRADYYADNETQAPAEKIEQRFLEMILTGDMPPGTVLNESELARRFGSSHGTVREFLIRFAPFGLIQKQPNRHWVLQGFTRAFAEEMFEVRLMFERRAMARLRAEGLTHSERAELQAMLPGHEAVISGDEQQALTFPQLDAAFHAWICRGARNRFIADFAEKIAMIVHYHYQWNKWDEVHRNREAAAEHVTIINAILEGQDRTAEILLDQHLTRSYGTLIASVRWDDAALRAANGANQD